MVKLRVHHLFCSALFEGKGYSDDFVANMQSIVDRLFPEGKAGVADDPSLSLGEGFGSRRTDDPLELIELCTEPDLVCSKCPNLQGSVCILDDNDVVSKDESLAKALGLICGRAYLREELIKTVAAALRQEIFENSCRKCRWYKEGLCSYQALRERYDAMAVLQMAGYSDRQIL